jgi:hypothetical protein
VPKNKSAQGLAVIVPETCSEGVVRSDPANLK